MSCTNIFCLFFVSRETQFELKILHLRVTSRRCRRRFTEEKKCDTPKSNARVVVKVFLELTFLSSCAPILFGWIFFFFTQCSHYADGQSVHEARIRLRSRTRSKYDAILTPRGEHVRVDSPRRILGGLN